ncbi:MAG: hypothetical protein E6I85_07530 [Chloroflexi bacterium]|nr:MAG: hypothetical protein E6I85_07530 [Chloroflexota bacterium]
MPDRRARDQREPDRARSPAAGRGAGHSLRRSSQAVPVSLQRRGDRAAGQVLDEVRAQLRVAAALAVVVLLLSACSLGASRPGLARHSPSPSSSPSRSPSPVPTAAPGAAWPQFLGGAERFGIGFSSPALTDIRQAWSAGLDGAEYGQPLVAGGHVIAATENDSVFSFDVASGALAWKQHLGDPVSGRSLPCGNIDPSGITSTPAIDPVRGTVYVVAYLSGFHHTLFALDLKTGAVRWQRPIDPPALSPTVHQQRSALSFANGRVYVPYGGLYGDCGNYRGWVIASAADGQGDLLSYEVKAGREAGIWAPGGAGSSSRPTSASSTTGRPPTGRR